MSAVLDRETFETPRVLEYFSEKELRAQIGLDIEFWPLAILRELIDNALDACEEAGVLPVIDISTADDTIVVTDNGPGIEPATIARSLDYLSRVSSKTYYVSPTRGAMGNAMKVVWAAPFVATGVSSVEITTRGERHTVTVSLDRIAQQPKIAHDVVKIDGFDTGDSPSLVDAKAVDSYRRGGRVQSETVKIGTSIKIAWADSTRLLNESDDDSYRSTAADLVASFVALNPHATFVLDGLRFAPTVSDWRKWSPTQPTSAHWYSKDKLWDLIAAYLTKDKEGNGEDRTVRDFVAEFRGLSGTAKRKAVTEGWSGRSLRDFVVDGDVDPTFVSELLSRMQSASAAPPPKALGVIGKDHLTAWMVANGVSRDSIRYSKKLATDRLPFVLEIAFGINDDDESTRRIVTGLNWSPVIGGDPDLTLRMAVSEARLDPHDPVTLVVHIARPGFQFADRGKTRLTLSGDITKAIESAMKSVTKSWKCEKQQADRNDRVASNRIARLRKKVPQTKIRDAAFRAMPDAYNKASSNGKYFANARQIMYAARPAILAETGSAQLDDRYFTQKLLKDYLDEYEPDWKVVWDARGHLVEPHTGTKIGLGGAEVERYIEQWGSVIDCRAKPGVKINVDTHGPENRFSNALFIEKQGFSEILADAGIERRYDIAILSTKGMTVDAACDVIAALYRKGVQTYVLRDFDYSGFQIAETLRRGTRRAPGSPVIDLGLRLADVEGLPSEPFDYDSRRKEDPRINLRNKYGATDDEAAFLVSGGYPNSWRGERVEINAMTSDQLIAWLEGKFEEHGIQKLVPEANTLNDAYRRAVFLKRMQAEIAELESAMQDDDTPIPKRLSARVKALLKKNPAMSWDQAVWELADDDAAT